MNQNSTIRTMKMSSTINFATLEEYRAAARGEKVLEGQHYPTRDNAYGILGNPTVKSLQKQIADLEGARLSLLYPNGAAANAHAINALTESGDQIFVPDACYSPTLGFVKNILKRKNVDVILYNPLELDSLENQINTKTKIIFVESPISNTFEVVDADRILKMCQENGLYSMIDASWSSGILAKFIPRGFDVSIIALTKYISGYNDVLMGAVSSSNNEVIRLLALDHHEFGVGVSPFDVLLVSRSIESVEARMLQARSNADKLVEMCENHTNVKKIYRPNKSDIFSDYFESDSCLFSIELKKLYSDEELQKMLDKLSVFKLGESWGGTRSLILPYLPNEFDGRAFKPENSIVRINSGLESIEQQLNDLKSGLDQL